MATDEIIGGVVDAIEAKSARIPRLNQFKPTGTVLQKKKYVYVYLRTFKEQMKFLYRGKATPEEMYDTLIFVGGFVVSEINENNKLTDEQKADKNEFEQLELKINNIYNAKNTKSLARYDFFCCTQKPYEDFVTYLQRLKDIHFDAKFGDDADELLRDKLVHGVLDSRIRERAIQRESTLEEVISHGTSLVYTEAQSKAMTQNKTSHVNKVNYDYNKSKGQKSDLCRYCGLDGHAQDRSSCPARSSHCHGCGLEGHWQQVCEKKGQKGQKGQRPKKFNKKKRFFKKKQNTSVHQVSDSADGDSLAQAFAESLY